MRIGVLGTGQVGGAISGRLASHGHDVVVGSRTPDSDKAQELAATTGVRVGTHAEAAAHGDWVFNALPGEAALELLKELDLGNRILVDIANYDHAVDQPIDVTLGESVQKALPDVRVVKALNSVSAHLMLDPGHLGQRHSVFVAGNDAEAKHLVTGLLHSFGWEDVLDLGDITACRAMEQLIPLWMKLEEVLGNPEFNLSVVRR